MQITNCAFEDWKTIFELYEKAIEYQKTKFHKHWQGFDRELVEREIKEKRLWKIVVDEQIACIFSVAFSDPQIWREKDRDAAIYIHRIVTNPDFRGFGFVPKIVEWAKEYAPKIGKEFIRMDTWGDNQKLIDYYRQCGFAFLGLTTPENTAALPKHYAGNSLSLFEIKI